MTQTATIEVGMPDAARLHRPSKLADRVAEYTHRDARWLLAQLAGERIHRREAIAIRAFPRADAEEIARRLAHLRAADRGAPAGGVNAAGA